MQKKESENLCFCWKWKLKQRRKLLSTSHLSSFRKQKCASNYLYVEIICFFSPTNGNKSSQFHLYHCLETMFSSIAVLLLLISWQPSNKWKRAICETTTDNERGRCGRRENCLENSSFLAFLCYCQIASSSSSFSRAARSVCVKTLSTWHMTRAAEAGRPLERSKSDADNFVRKP